MKNCIKNFNTNNDILIIGNSKNILQYELGEFIDKNFFIIRFKSMTKEDKENNINFKTKVLNNKIHTGKNIDMIFQKFKPIKYFKNKQVIKIISARSIRSNFRKKYKRKISRGLQAILFMLEVYEYKQINRPVFIHGFSFNRTNIYKEQFKDLEKLDMGVGYHNYELEKKIINDLINEGKVQILCEVDIKQYKNEKLNKKRDLKFIHITKNAGTYIEDMAMKTNILYGKFDKEYNVKNCKRGGWHGLPSLLNRNILNNYDWFMVVRNPYDRILSEYYCKWGGIGRKKNHSSVNDFNNYIIDKINTRNTNGDHYTEQYLYHENINTNLHIIKYENLYNELNDLFKKYNLKIILEDKKINTSRKRKFTASDFNNELITLINNVYDKDFTLFNYKKNLV